MFNLVQVNVCWWQEAWDIVYHNLSSTNLPGAGAKRQENHDCQEYWRDAKNMRVMADIGDVLCFQQGPLEELDVLKICRKYFHSP